MTAMTRPNAADCPICGESVIEVTEYKQTDGNQNNIPFVIVETEHFMLALGVYAEHMVKNHTDGWTGDAAIIEELEKNARNN